MYLSSMENRLGIVYMNFYGQGASGGHCILGHEDREEQGKVKSKSYMMMPNCTCWFLQRSCWEDSLSVVAGVEAGIFREGSGGIVCGQFFQETWFSPGRRGSW